MNKKNAVITGANGGIGKALCAEFSAAGYSVIATDRNRDENLPCDHFIPCDLLQFVLDERYRSETAAKILTAAGPALNALVNNAATQILGSTESLTVKQWHDTMDVNLIAPFLLTQSFLRELTAAGGSVVNISSVHQTATKPGFVAYATSKTALSGLTRSMAIDLGGKVRINAIAPAATATPMLMAGFKGKEQKYKELSEMHPIGRIATPAEIAQTALFLTSPSASFITGSIISVDGGISGRLHDPI